MATEQYGLSSNDTDDRSNDNNRPIGSALALIPLTPLSVPIRTARSGGGGESFLEATASAGLHASFARAGGGCGAAYLTRLRDLEERVQPQELFSSLRRSFEPPCRHANGRAEEDDFVSSAAAWLGRERGGGGAASVVDVVFDLFGVQKLVT